MLFNVWFVIAAIVIFLVIAVFIGMRKKKQIRSQGAMRKEIGHDAIGRPEYLDERPTPHKDVS